MEPESLSRREHPRLGSSRSVLRIVLIAVLVAALVGLVYLVQHPTREGNPCGTGKSVSSTPTAIDDC
jgi:hypothetical protein